MLSNLNSYSAKMDRKTIKEMVVAFRENRPDQKHFNYSHFGAIEIIKMFIDNGIISNVVFNNAEEYGLKIYIGNHFDLSNCPGNDDTEKARYLNYNTTILCNTIIRGEHQYEDMLQSDENVTHMSTSSDDGGYGLDQSVLCPPDCMPDCLADSNYPEYCIFDIGREPTPPPITT